MMTFVTDELISDDLLQTLRYLRMVNDGGAAVERHDLDAWAHLPPPSSHTAGGLGYGLIYSLDRRDYAEYLLGVGWAAGNPMRITAVGRAVLKSHDGAHAGGPDNERALVILSPSDPLNLVALTSAVAAAKAGTLVDPYFSDDLFAWLLEATSIERVLLCRSDDKRATLRLVAGAAERAGRSLEIRCLPRRDLHDRFLLSEAGSVSSIGSSFNGVNRNFTTIAPMPEPAAQAIRDYVDARWEEAARIEPQPELRVVEPTQAAGTTAMHKPARSGTDTAAARAEPGSSPL